jgi:hypothetical protein
LDVVALGSDHEVVWADTGRVVTDMTDDHALRNGAVSGLPRGPMGADQDATHAEPALAFGVPCSHPDEAAVALD